MGTSNYAQLVAYMKANADDPVNLAKTITAWIWTSLLPGGYGPTPTSATNAAEVLTGTCGWRHILMSSLFKEIGIESRAVNFYNVPFQGNHTTTELKIGNKWMLFDPTFGLFFQAESGGAPLSAAEARAKWPDVKVMKADLTGWQGTFASLSAINPSSAFKAYTDAFFYRPESIAKYPNVLSGEVSSLYFGPEAAYFVDGERTAIPSDRTWVTRVDTTDKYAWMRYVDSFDKAGRRDWRWTEFDKDSKTTYAILVDWDQDNRHTWSSKTTFVGNTRNAVINYVAIRNDDGTKVIIDYDTVPYKYAWSVKTTTFTARGKMDYEHGSFDDGRTWFRDWDDQNASSRSWHQDIYNASGGVISTTIVSDDGTTTTVVWESVGQVTGTSEGNVLVGSDQSDLLRGLAGDDLLDGQAGIDRLEGGKGNDTYIVDSLEDFVIERSQDGIDTVRATANYILPTNVEKLVLVSGRYGTGNAQDNFIAGNADANVLSGLAGRDRLSGGAGNDILSGGVGRDVVEGGPGADILTGGRDADTFIWRNTSESGEYSAAADLVLDFNARDGDRLDFSHIDASVVRSGLQAFTFIGVSAFTAPGQIRAIQVAGETRLLLNTDADAAPEMVVRVKGLHSVSDDWFIL